MKRSQMRSWVYGLTVPLLWLCQEGVASWKVSPSEVAPSSVPQRVAPPKGTRNLRKPEFPILAGEKLHYDVMFWGVPAGRLTVETGDEPSVQSQARGRKIQHLRGRFKSSTVLSLFQRIDDRVESWWDYEGLFSHRYDVLVDESTQQRKLTETHDSVALKSIFADDWKKKDQERQVRKLESVIPPFPQDLFSSLFYIRTLYPAEAGGELRFPLINEGKTLEGAVTYLRRERLEVKPLGGKVDTVVLVPFTRLEGVRQQKEDSYLWFSADPRRYLVRMEARTRIGFVVAQLVEIESPGRP